MNNGGTTDMEMGKGLENQLDELHRLDGLRTRAHLLQERGIKGIVQTTYERGMVGWHDPGDDVEKALLVHCVQTVPDKFLRATLVARFGLEKLQRLSLSELFDCQFGPYE